MKKDNEMDAKDQLMASLIDALSDHNYEVVIEEPNNVSIRETYDGSKYLYIRGDGVKFGVSFGSCTVSVQGHSFTCDLNFGEWSAEDDEDSWLIEEEDFIDTIESADGVICGVMGEPDEQAEVFCRANNIKNNMPVYWCEDDDIPKDIDNLDMYDPAVVIVSVLMPDGQDQDVECELSCSSIYKLYCSLKKKRKLYKNATVSSAYIEKELPYLHQEILDELQIQSDLAQEPVLTYHLANSKDMFESALG